MAMDSRKPNIITVNFSSGTMKACRKRHNTIQVLKEIDCQPKILYPVKISFRNKREIKTFQVKEN